MAKTQIDSEAKKLVIAIGVHVEQWIIDRARSLAERRAVHEGKTPVIESEHIRESLDLLFREGATDLKSSIEQYQGTHAS